MVKVNIGYLHPIASLGTDVMSFMDSSNDKYQLQTAGRILGKTTGIPGKPINYLTRAIE